MNALNTQMRAEIGEALRENGRVIVTGCLGAEPDYITGAHPRVLRAVEIACDKK